MILHTIRFTFWAYYRNKVHQEKKRRSERGVIWYLWVLRKWHIHP